MECLNIPPAAAHSHDARNRRGACLALEVSDRGSMEGLASNMPRRQCGMPAAVESLLLGQGPDCVLDTFALRGAL